jgi:hypothetical protein
MELGWLVGEPVNAFTIDLHTKFDAPVSGCLLVLLSDRHLKTDFLRYYSLDSFNKANTFDARDQVAHSSVAEHVTSCRWVRNI